MFPTSLARGPTGLGEHFFAQVGNVWRTTRSRKLLYRTWKSINNIMSHVTLRRVTAAPKISDTTLGWRDGEQHRDHADDHALLQWNEEELVGDEGPQGPSGLMCWDVDADGVPDPSEDRDGKGVYDAEAKSPVKDGRSKRRSPARMALAP